jgi:hypothetical protein
VTDYNTLIGTSNGSIADWVNSTAVANSAPTIVNEAQSDIYRRLRHWQMLTSTNGTMTTSQATMPVPTDYLQEKLFYVTGTAFQKMVRKPVQEVIQQYSYDGSGNRIVTQPQYYFNDQSNFQFDSPSDQPYPFLMYYYQQPTPLSSTNTANFLTNTYPRLMRAACMVAAAEYMKDAGMGNYDRTYWEQVKEMELDKAQVESDMHERSIEAGAILI